ncbi:hypothetical protein BD769DRAFT_1635006 [Suillus cothurnatus]|nr:hypothetical protein BD769DRAFT_1635006 [Suillus cothurnatus]
MSSFNGNWPGAETSAFGFQIPDTGSHTLPSAPAAANMELHSPVPAAVGIELQHNPVPIEPFTFLLTPITNIALANSTLTVLYYVLCDPDVFEKGIKYTKEGLQSTPSVANACILTKQCLNTHSMKENSFRAACKDYIIKMVTVTNHAGQPVEQGMKCLQTNKVKPLDMVYAERYKFMKSLKENSLPLADEVQKKYAGGYCLNDYNIEMVIPLLCMIFSEATRIILILALRILQLPRVHHWSLLDIFPNQYQKLPEHLIANACGMYVIYFRHQLPGYPWAKISSNTLEREAAHQLQLLRAVCQNGNADTDAHELNTWIDTQDGLCGWLQDLQDALNLVNRQ